MDRERYEISEEAARKRVDRAIEKLRAMAARKGVTEATAAGSIAGVMDHQMHSAAPSGVSGRAVRVRPDPSARS